MFYINCENMSVLATSTMCNVQRGSELNHDSSKLTDYIMEMWAYRY